MAQNPMGPIINNQGIITQGQIGDNYIIQFKSPTVSVIGYREPTKNSDGSYNLQLVFRLDAQAPANYLLVAVKEEDVSPPPNSSPGFPGGGIDVWPLGFAGGLMKSSGKQQGYVWQRIQTPTRGDYALSIRVKSAAVKPRVEIQTE